MSDREQFVEQVSDELDTLKRRLADTRAKAADVGDTVEIRVHAAGESVEEAIQEAHKALDRYKDAAETDAVALRDNIDHLLASARTTLEQIARMIDEAAEQATAT